VTCKKNEGGHSDLDFLLIVIFYAFMLFAVSG
jgi:hypothetical protein